MTRFALARRAVALAALAWPRSAGASPDRVVFEPAECAPAAFDEGAFEQLLRVELTSAGVREVSVSRPGVERGAASPLSTGSPPVHLVLDGTCVDGGIIGARLRGPSPADDVVRWIPLGDVPRAARPRTIALALAELVQAGPPGPPEPPVPRASPRAAQPSPQVAAMPAPPPRPLPLPAPRWSLAATAEARGFLPEGGALFGARVAARYALPPFTVGAAIGAWHGSSSDPLGEVGAWLASGALGATVGGRAGAIDLHAGPELEVGWVHANGTAASGALGYTRDDIVVLANLRGSLRFAVAGPVSGVLDGAVGAALRGYVAQAADRSPLAVRNAALSAGLGLAVAY